MPKEDLTNRDLVMRYFLGSASETERSRVEESLADDETFFDLIVIEDQLLYDFINSRLSQADSELFEQNYLSQSRERQERFLLAKTLIRYADEWEEEPDSVTPKPDQGWASLPTVGRYRGFWIPAKLATTTALAIILALGILSWISWKQRKELARLQQQRVTEHSDLQNQLSQRDQQIQSLHQELARLKSPSETTVAVKKPGPRHERQDNQQKQPDNSAPEEIATATDSDYVLDPVERGGSAKKEVSIPRKADITLVLKIRSTKFPIYQVELQEEASSTSPDVFPGSPTLTRYGRVIRLKISTQTRPAGKYVVSVLGLKGNDSDRIPIESFRFRLE
jgi:type II secretory pathway pseudopilin PulG